MKYQAMFSWKWPGRGGRRMHLDTTQFPNEEKPHGVDIIDLNIRSANGKEELVATFPLHHKDKAIAFTDFLNKQHS